MAKEKGASENKGKKTKNKTKVKVFTKKNNQKDVEANIIEKLQAKYESVSKKIFI